MRTEYDAIIDEGAARLADALRQNPCNTVRVFALHTRPNGARGELVATTWDTPDAPAGDYSEIVPRAGRWNAVPYSGQRAELWSLCRGTPILATA